MRYETSYSRMHDRAMKALYRLREEQDLRNDPKPAPPAPKTPPETVTKPEQPAQPEPPKPVETNPATVHVIVSNPENQRPIPTDS